MTPRLPPDLWDGPPFLLNTPLTPVLLRTEKSKLMSDFGRESCEWGRSHSTLLQKEALGLMSNSPHPHRCTWLPSSSVAACEGVRENLCPGCKVGSGALESSSYSRALRFQVLRTSFIISSWKLLLNLLSWNFRAQYAISKGSCNQNLDSSEALTFFYNMVTNASP